MLPCSSLPGLGSRTLLWLLYINKLSCAIKDLFGSFLGTNMEICVGNEALHCGVNTLSGCGKAEDGREYKSFGVCEAFHLEVEVLQGSLNSGKCEGFCLIFPYLLHQDSCSATTLRPLVLTVLYVLLHPE